MLWATIPKRASYSPIKSPQSRIEYFDFQYWERVLIQSENCFQSKIFYVCVSDVFLPEPPSPFLSVHVNGPFANERTLLLFHLKNMLHEELALWMFDETYEKKGGHLRWDPPPPPTKKGTYSSLCVKKGKRFLFAIWLRFNTGIIWNRRKIRLMRSNAKYRLLKKITCKGTSRQVFICLRPRIPYPLTPLLTVYVYKIYLLTQEWRESWT